MPITAIVLIATLSCTPVQQARSRGYSDQQIEQYAREHHVPEWIIAWCKRHC